MVCFYDKVKTCFSPTSFAVKINYFISDINVREFFTRVVSLIFDANLLKELEASTAPAKTIGSGTSSISVYCLNLLYFIITITVPEICL